MGVVFRYIYSDLGFGASSTSTQPSGASAFSADISGYFVTYPIVGQSECQFAWGWDISNIGTKVSPEGQPPAFLPTNLRLGASFMFPLADYHNLAVSLDLNKLLVPTRPRRDDYRDSDGQVDEAAYAEALNNWETMSPITGIFKSFSDAPGGMKEELREISYSIGAEYNYNQQFFLRAGYYHESHPPVFRLWRRFLSKRRASRRGLYARHCTDLPSRPDPPFHIDIRYGRSP